MILKKVCADNFVENPELKYFYSFLGYRNFGELSSSAVYASSYDLFRGSTSVNYENEDNLVLENLFFTNGKKIINSVSNLSKNSTNKNNIEIANKKNNIKEINYIPNLQFDRIIGKSEKIEKVKQDLFSVKDKNCKVLFYGESGTGKSLTANVLHKISDRKDKKYVCVNVGVIPKDLIESTLFGTVKGAYTDAVHTQGLIELAKDGVMFLDEIGELPLCCQVKLLRALDEGVFRKVGSEKEIQTQARFVFATNANLKELVRKKEFREDLYWRIAEFIIEIPPLRERPEDILLIANKFLEQRKSTPDLTPQFFSQDAKDKLLSHTWPGNIRELKNCINIATILSKSEKIEASCIKFDSL